MAEIAMFAVAGGFLALIGLEAERVLNEPRGDRR